MQRSTTFATRTALARTFTALLAIPVAAAQVETELVAADGGGNDFGRAVTIEGDRALVGAQRDSAVGNLAGSAYVFERVAGVWVETAKLTATTPIPSALFGAAVALDGDRLLVGADHPILTTGIGSGANRAYVFDLVSGSWSQTAILFGVCSAVALDGDRIVMGSGSTTNGGLNFGQATVRELQNGVWTQTALLLPSDGQAQDYFGNALALEGDRIVVGSYQDDDAGPESGSVYVFDLQNGAWVETAKLTANDATSADRFGFSVALSGDRILAGAHGRDAFGLSNAGAAYVFENVAGWTQTAKLVSPNPAAANRFGRAVALHGDRAVIGEDGAGPGNNTGAAWWFEFDQGAWTDVAELRGSDLGSSDDLGEAVAVTDDFALVGAPEHRHPPDLIPRGGAYVFDLTCIGSSVAPYCTGKTNTEGCVPYVDCSGGPPSATSPNAFLVLAADVLNQKPGLLFYGTMGPAAQPFLGGTLCVQQPIRRTPLQTSGGNSPPDDCSGSYTFDLTAWLLSGVDPGLVSGLGLNVQYWYRDPADAFGIGLSNALELVIE